MLFHNEIVAGQKVPFKDLAVQMGMSVTPVIQALKFLEFQGLVRREPNKGYFIETLKLDELEGLYKFRKVLELTMLEAVSYTHLDVYKRQRLLLHCGWAGASIQNRGLAYLSQSMMDRSWPSKSTASPTCAQPWKCWNCG